MGSTVQEWMFACLLARRDSGRSIECVFIRVEKPANTSTSFCASLFPEMITAATDSWLRALRRAYKYECRGL